MLADLETTHRYHVLQFADGLQARIVSSGIGVQEQEGLASFNLSSELEMGDVDSATAQSRSHSADHTGLVHPSNEDQVSG